MTESEFKASFTTTFLASWCAANYAHACLTGGTDRLYEPPVEDALDLADAAWDEYLKHR